MNQSPDKEVENPGRRRLLKVAGVVALGASLPVLGVEAIRQIAKEGIVTDFSTATSNYRFLGAAHGNPSLGQLNIVTSLRKELVPDDTTAFEIETGTLDYLAPDIYPQLDKIYWKGPQVEEYAFAKEVMLKLAEKKVPLILTDVPVQQKYADNLLSYGIILAATPAGLFAGMDSNISRRKFLRRAAAAVVGLTSLRMASDDVMAYLRSCASQDWAQTLSSVNHYAELSKPESLFTTFRNCIISVKTLGLESDFPKISGNDKAKALLIYGFGHWGIPEYMKSGQQAILNYLSFYPKSFIEAFFGRDNLHLYTSAVITPQNDGFKVEKVENSSLKNLFNGK